MGPTFGLVGVNSHRHKDIVRKISGCKPFLGRLSVDIIISQRCLFSKSASVASEMFWGLERASSATSMRPGPHLLLRLRPGLRRCVRWGPDVEDWRPGTSLRPLRGRFGGRAGL